jgi:hypothetical protein
MLGNELPLPSALASMPAAMPCCCNLKALWSCTRYRPARLPVLQNRSAVKTAVVLDSSSSLWFAVPMTGHSHKYSGEVLEVLTVHANYMATGWYFSRPTLFYSPPNAHPLCCHPVHQLPPLASRNWSGDRSWSLPCRLASSSRHSHQHPSCPNATWVMPSSAPLVARSEGHAQLLHQETKRLIQTGAMVAIE